MAHRLEKRAAEMLLNGATLLAEPCPYCSGVRVMKDGSALCTSCGAEPVREARAEPVREARAEPRPIDALQSKLQALTGELTAEGDHQRQQEILRSIRSIIDTMDRLKGKSSGSDPSNPGNPTR